MKILILNFVETKFFAGGTICEQRIVNKEVNDIPFWKKVSGGLMVNKVTGEVKNYVPSLSRGDNMKSVTVSLKKARDIVFNNFSNKKKVYSVDFTYSYPQRWYEKFIKDLKKLQKDIRKINPNVKIIIFKEINKNGVYHGHMFMTDIEITESQFRELWKEGKEISFKIIKDDKDLIKKTYYLTNISGNTKKSKRKREAYKHFPANKQLYMTTKNLDKTIKTIKMPIDYKEFELMLQTPKEKADKQGVIYKTYVKSKRTKKRRRYLNAFKNLIKIYFRQLNCTIVSRFFFMSSSTGYSSMILAIITAGFRGRCITYCCLL